MMITTIIVAAVLLGIPLLIYVVAKLCARFIG